MVLGEVPKGTPGPSVIAVVCHVEGASIKDDESHAKSGTSTGVFEKMTFDAGKKVLGSDLELDVPLLGEKTK